LYKSDQKVQDEIAKSRKSFLPEAGFCLKTKTANSGEKIFLNICSSVEISAPKDITEEQLVALIENVDQDAAFQFRVPMSLGEPHTELDNGKN